jgi:hypothetical protein
LSKAITQRAINTLVRRMRVQRRPAMDDRYFDCTNVSPDGARCALSLFFRPAYAKRVSNETLKENLTRAGVDPDIVEAMRQAHDSAARLCGLASRPALLAYERFMVRFERELRQMIECRGYTMPEAQ